MSQALYTSKTGLDAGQTQINVIANNVANINTTAFKSANVTFSTLFSNTLSSGSAEQGLAVVLTLDKSVWVLKLLQSQGTLAPALSSKLVIILT